MKMAESSRKVNEYMYMHIYVWICCIQIVHVYMYICSCVSSGPEPKPVLSGNSRTYRVWMDTNQYQRDMARVVKGEEVSEHSSVCEWVLNSWWGRQASNRCRVLFQACHLSSAGNVHVLDATMQIYICTHMYVHVIIYPL